MDNTARCNSMKSYLEQEKSRLEGMKANLAGVEAELVQLQRRIDDLNRQKSDLANKIKKWDHRVKTVTGQYQKDCSASESCTQYEGFATSLKTQADTVEKEIAVVRTDIGRSQAETNSLRAAIEPLRSEYTNLNCNNQVPGETAQSTIDRCYALFSEWNRLQARLNQQNMQLSNLKTRYEQLLAELRNIEARAKGYEGYMAANCSTSPKVAELRGYGGVRQRAETLGKELDQLIDDVTKLRGIQITVSPK